MVQGFEVGSCEGRCAATVDCRMPEVCLSPFVSLPFLDRIIFVHAHIILLPAATPQAQQHKEGWELHVLGRLRASRASHWAFGLHWLTHVLAYLLLARL